MLWALRLLVMTIGLGIGSAAVAQANMAQVSLQRLDAPARESLDQYLGQPLLLMVFEPECSWCFRQVATLNALQAECSEPVRVIGIGVSGSRSELRQEIQRSKPQFPSYRSNAQLTEILGDVPATPMLFFTDEQLEPVMKFRGFVAAEQLIPAAEAVFGTSCH